MVVNRVFCYSKEVAKKNGNNLPILQLVLTFVIGISAIIMLIILLKDNFNDFYLLGVMFIWFAIIIYYSVLLGLRLRTRITGYATDSTGRIFKAMTINNGQGLFLGGYAAGNLLDQVVGNDSSVLGDVGGAIGGAAQLYALNRSAQYMSHPEIIAKMVELAPNITGAEVFEILRVYSITDKRKIVKIKCDYKIIRTNKIKYAKNLTIEKSYNMYEDLIKVLNTHR